MSTSVEDRLFELFFGAVAFIVGLFVLAAAIWLGSLSVSAAVCHWVPDSHRCVVLDGQYKAVEWRAQRKERAR